jgi:hypothetical protein
MLDGSRGELIERAVQNREHNPDTRLFQQRNADARLVLRFHKLSTDPVAGWGPAYACSSADPRAPDELREHTRVVRGSAEPGSVNQ